MSLRLGGVNTGKGVRERCQRGVWWGLAGGVLRKTARISMYFWGEGGEGFLFEILLFFYVQGCFAACLCTVCNAVPAEDRKGRWIAQNRSHHGCESLCGRWQSKLGPQEEQPVLLSAEPFCYPHLLPFKGRTILHCMNRPHLVHPFIYRWMLGAGSCSIKCFRLHLRCASMCVVYMCVKACVRACLSVCVCV